jgi:SAM-dependent methyltransferase
MYEIETTHWWFRSLHELVIGSLEINNKAPTHILDAGCGTGRLMVQLQGHGEIKGLDFRDTALSYCRKRSLSNVRKMDLNKWDPIENQFEYIISLDVLSDLGIKNDKLTLQKFHKALKPGGKLILHVPAFPILTRNHDKAATIRKRYRKNEIKDIAKGVGFFPINVHYRLSFVFPLFLMLKLFQSLSFRHKTPKSDLFQLPTLANGLLLSFSRWENILLKSGLSLPWGTSLFSILQKS